MPLQSSSDASRSHAYSLRLKPLHTVEQVIDPQAYKIKGVRLDLRFDCRFNGSEEHHDYI
jgi:hypothetical protein